MQIIISYCDFYINISEWNLVCSIDLKRKKTILEGFIWKKWVISKRKIYSLWYSVALKLTVNIQFHFNCDNLCQAWFQIYNFHYAPFDSYVCMCVLSVDQRLIAAGLGTPLLLLAPSSPPEARLGPPGSAGGERPDPVSGQDTLSGPSVIAIISSHHYWYSDHLLPSHNPS